MFTRGSYVGAYLLPTGRVCSPPTPPCSEIPKAGREGITAQATAGPHRQPCTWSLGRGSSMLPPSPPPSPPPSSAPPHSLNTWRKPPTTSSAQTACLCVNKKWLLFELLCLGKVCHVRISNLHKDCRKLRLLLTNSKWKMVGTSLCIKSIT